MSTDLIPRLKPLVTTFSEAIRYTHSHKDVVKVGGRIKSILNLSRLEPDGSGTVFITLDDEVGEVCVMLPGQVYTELDSKYSFVKDMVVVADGKILDPEGTLQKKTEPKVHTKYFRSQPEQEPLRPEIVGWNLIPLDQAETVQSEE